MKRIERTEYLNKLIAFKDKSLIKVSRQYRQHPIHQAHSRHHDCRRKKNRPENRGTILHLMKTLLPITTVSRELMP